MKSTPIIVAIATALTVSSALAQTPAQNRRASQCFRSEEYKSFRALNDHSFNIRVNVSDYYHVELQGVCPEILSPDATLITHTRGSDYICDGLDWDLRIKAGPGIPVTPCIVQGQTRLTPEQVAAIPPDERP